ncbi:TetR/AcrR family transcriptional regulator [Frankia sp. AiPs1]|uniref:TetR/AcrR family transcriptional regulator n=1 Tax=Frankia sp. AiPs1 TaxID=573493 RepID=UPI0020436BDC|nr:TetR/AcrR family transcriptional regulator [Frankia sp. AiPs1]MCM3920372.1 TetR/AcrR family transcriptional regulator [Frankia sp. AiPs1]
MAREAFAAEGLEISMEEISRRAGLATATLYRRFPTKEALAAAAFAEQLAACGHILDLALADPDPWRGFCRFVLRLCTQQQRDRRFLTAFAAAFPHRTEFEVFRRRADERFAQLVCRAQETGSLRPDFVPADLSLILLASGGIDAGGRELTTAASRRLASYLVQAFRADRATPLAPPLRTALDLPGSRQP